MAVNQVARACSAWPILTNLAAQRSTITYGELGRALKVHHRPVRYLLEVIQDYCLEEKLPPLTILVESKSGRPGSGFIAYDSDNLDEGREKVYAFDWKAVANPFDFSASGDSYQSLVTALINDPTSAPAEIYSRVKSRGIKQIIFRDALLQAYSRRCAFTKIQFTEALEACHIVPWSQASHAERMDVRNGLLLNKLHHRLFDLGRFALTEDHRIMYFDPRGEKRNYSAFERQLTLELHGKPMHVPHRRALRPDPGFLERHQILVGWGSGDIEA